jgi:hypothetical protein
VRWHRVLTRAIVVGLLPALASCGHRSAPPVPGPMSDAQVLDIAQQLLERQCMIRHGFRMSVSSHEPVADMRDFPYVIDDVAWAGRHGYGSDLRRALDRYRATEPNGRYFASLDAGRRAAALDALHGTGPGRLTAHLPGGGVVAHSDTGCTAEAEGRLYRDLPAWFRLSHVKAGITPVVRNQVQNDPRYQAATGRWAQCMRRSGQPATDPADARARGLASARRAEIALAVAEATCAQTTLGPVSAQLDAERAAALRSAYRTDLDLEQSLRSAALPRARVVVANAPAGILPDGV